MASTCTPPSAGDCEQTGAAESDFPTMVDAIQHTYFDDEDNAQVDAMHSNENLCDSFSGALKAEGSAPTVEAHRPLKRGLKRKRHRTNSSSIKPREGKLSICAVFFIFERGFLFLVFGWDRRAEIA